MGEDGEIHDTLWLINLDGPENNDWLVVNQFTVVEDRRTRRPDVLVFVNGLPLVVIELKNPADEKTTIFHAFNQLQNYKKEIPCLFAYNELMIVSDGLQARLGTLTSGWDRFMPWRTIEGIDTAPTNSVELEVLIKGIFAKQRFLDLILNFIVFEDNGGGIFKKAAAYHQFHAVNKAVECTFSACGFEYDHSRLIGRYPAFRGKMAGEMRGARLRGEKLGLNEDEIAFYDALEVNDSAVKVLGSKTLKTIARELVAAVRRSVTIDWTVRENARARIRVMVKRILRKYGYPPDKQEKATQTVLQQAEVLCKEWAV